jgi:uncharacterized protein
MFSKGLLPKEEKYFSDFKKMVSYVHEIGMLVNELFSAGIPDNILLLKIKPLEIRCDELRSRVITRLNKTFITPFDREDIFALIKRLNSISDLLMKAANRVDIFNIRRKIKYAEELSEIILQQLIVLDTVIQDLKVKRISETEIVRQLGIKADVVYQEAIKELFKSEPDPVILIKEKEVLEILRDASHKCQSLANIVQSIHIKNS